MASVKNIFLTLGTGTFLFMSLFGVFSMSMGMSMDGKMSDCPFMPGMSLCPMSPLEHASYMHDLFANIPQQADSLLAFLLTLGAAAVIAFAWFKNIYAPPDLVYQRVQFGTHRSLSIEPLLQQLFSNGILNPKLFS